VKLYGHYALINGKDTSFYRHLIRYLGLPDPTGKDKWTAYKFTLSVYNDFYPIHHKRITSAVDQLPDPEVFAVQTRSEQSGTERTDSQLGDSYSQETAAQPPSSQTSEPVFKKPRTPGEK
jgi:hypothetical protein